jgi:imidazole glycerol-phosphate synthase subunit HisH
MIKADGEITADSPKQVVIMDYGAGNVGSLVGALHRLNYRVRVSAVAMDFQGADAVILPGVGAMPSAIKSIRNQGLDKVIGQLLADGKIPVIGICLGMQLMFEHSEEGDVAGLGMLGGVVRRLSNVSCHVGWANCYVPLGDDYQTEAAVYFNHSYFVEPDPSILKSVANVEGHGDIAAIVQSGNFVGMQFHPEKSQSTGAALLRHFIEPISRGAYA